VASEVGGGVGTEEESPPVGCVTDETDYFLSVDDMPRISAVWVAGRVQH